MKKRHEQKLVVLALTTALLLNVPFIMIFNEESAIFGIPVFYIAVFFIWLLSIVISYIIIKRHYE